MSYQKKSIILHELQQAIKKKAQQKSKNKEQLNRVLQSSIQKKKVVLKTVTNKDNRISSINKNSQLSNKPQKTAIQQISIFNNEHLNTIESSQLKFKKYNNRKIDKLISLIQYMISSSEKALKYISSTNFQAQFALKLYKSDKENLINEVKNLNFEEIMDNQKNEKQSSNKMDQNFNLLLQQNNKLKKQILILQKEAQRYHKGIILQEHDQITKNIQKQNIKLKKMFRKLISFDSYKQIIQLLDKQNKLENMFEKYNSNHKKAAQIEILMNKFEEERGNIVQALSKSKPQNKTDRTYKIYEIQQQKEQLQKELNQMKFKLTDIIESSKSLSQLELLKKNNELVNEKLNSLYIDLSENYQQKTKRKTNDELINYIRNHSLELMNSYKQSTYLTNKLQNEMEQLKGELVHLKQYRNSKENEFNQRQDQMQEMLERYEKFKNKEEALLNENEEMNNYIKQLENQREQFSMQTKSLELKLEISEKQKMRLNLKLTELTNSHEKKTQQTSKKLKEATEKAQKLQQTLQKYEQKYEHMDDIKAELQQNIKSLQQELQIKKYQIKKLNEENQLANVQPNNQHYEEEMKQLKRSIKLKESQIASVVRKGNVEKQELKGEIQEKQSLIYDLSKKNEVNVIEILQLKNELQRMRHQNTSTSQRLRCIQDEMISNAYAKDELKKYKEECERLIILLQQKEIQERQKDREIEQMNGQISQHHTALKKQQRQQKQQQQQQQQQQRKQQIALTSQHQTLLKEFQQKTSQLLTLKQEYGISLLQTSRLLSLLEQQRNRHKQLASTHLKLSAQVENMKTTHNKQLQSTIKQLKQQTQANQSNIIKINALQDQLYALNQEKSSLLSQLKQKKLEEQGLKSSIKNYQRQVNEMNKEMMGIKERMQNQHEINHFKNTQYTNLLKQILKGLLSDFSKYQKLTSFEELLQFGAKEVVQLRKKQRDEQSIKRKNTRRELKDKDDLEQIQMQYFSDLDDCKTKLFSMEDNNSNLVLKESKESNANNVSQVQTFVVQQREQAKQMVQDDDEDNNNMQQVGLDLDQFGELKEQINTSMISEDNLHQNIIQQSEQNGLQQFDEIKSQKLNESAISLPFQQQQSQQEDVSQKSKQIEKEALCAEQGNNNEQQIQIRYSMVNSKQVDDIQEDGLELLHNNNSMFCGNVLSYKPQKDKFKVDLDDLDEIKSCQQNQSVVSDRSLIEQQEIQNDRRNSFEQQEIKAQRQDDKLDEIGNISEIFSKPSDKNPLRMSNESIISDIHDNQHKVDPVVNNFISSMVSQGKSQEQNEVEQLNIDQFGQIKDNSMNNSVVSQTKEEFNFDQFKEIPNDINSSMISQKNEEKGQEKPEEEYGISQFGEILQNQLNNQSVDSHNIEQKDQQEHNLSQFGEIKDHEVNDSVISQVVQEKQDASGLGLSQFHEIEEDKMNSSVLSNKNPGQDHQEHGLSQFGDINQNGHNDSVLSNKIEQNLQGQIHGLDEFNEIAENNINNSIVSDKNVQKEAPQQMDLAQFNQIQENPINTSVISQQQQHNLSQFGEMIDNNMNDSMLSQKDETSQKEAIASNLINNLVNELQGQKHNSDNQQS